MFDIGWTELLIVGVVALIVVGPKDLPKMFRALGQFTAKARNMAREFQRAMDAAADETGVKDMERDLRKATSAKDMGLDDLDDLARGGKRARPGKAARTGSRKPAADPEGEAAADAELDTVTREMERQRNERGTPQKQQQSRSTASAAKTPGADTSDASEGNASEGTGPAARGEGPAS